MAAPASRKQRNRDKRNAIILDTAEHLFAWKGFQQTTMEEVAGEAGVSVGTLYNLFEDKEDLYAQVSERLGRGIMERFSCVVKTSDPESAVLDLIRLRLYNYVNDRLFFQPFYFPSYLGVQPEPGRLGPRVNELHRQYEELVEQVFQRRRGGKNKSQSSYIKMAAYLEGILSAFMGYWSGPVQSDQLAKTARQIREMLLRGIDAPNGLETREQGREDSRSIYISRYDLDRLRELIEVVRAFGHKEGLANADALDAELTTAHVTNPREVPPDVVTMNSKVRIRNLDDGSDRILMLVFPKDADLRKENLSILNPLGMAVFGRRVEDVFMVTTGNESISYRVEQILYQPEAVGDYHL